MIYELAYCLALIVMYTLTLRVFNKLTQEYFVFLNKIFSNYVLGLDIKW
jgi:hypothetical protein